MHRTLKKGTTIPPATGPVGQQKKFDRFRKEFNTQRPHEALKMKTPQEIYQHSDRSFPKKIEPYDYPSHYLVRRVSRCGTVRLLKRQFFASQTLNEDFVGLE